MSSTGSFWAYLHYVHIDCLAKRTETKKGRKKQKCSETHNSYFYWEWGKRNGIFTAVIALGMCPLVLLVS